MPGPTELLGRLHKVIRTARGWSAQCPAHHDRRNSLSLTLAVDGKLLLHCFTGCRPEEILAALGLTWADLFPVREGTAERPRYPKPKPEYLHPLEEARAEVLERERRAQERRDFYRPLLEASEALREQRRAVAGLRAAATKIGDRETVWDALCFAARIDTRLEALESELDTLLSEGPFRPV